VEKHTIIGIHITDRLKRAADVQKAFTEFGGNIKTRLGLHDVQSQACSPNGLVLLEVCGPDADLARFEATLRAIEGVDVQKMVFTHP
jgi:hypothetical protein